MTDPVWLAQLIQILCQMFEEWGGNCSTLPQTASGRIQALTETFDSEGVPEFESQDAQNEFLTLLNEVEAHLSLPGNCLATSDLAALETLISELRSGVERP